MDYKIPVDLSMSYLRAIQKIPRDTAGEKFSWIGRLALHQISEDIEQFPSELLSLLHVKMRTRIVKTLEYKLKDLIFAQQMFIMHTTFAYNTIVKKELVLPAYFIKQIFRKNLDLAVRFLKLLKIIYILKNDLSLSNTRAEIFSEKKAKQYLKEQINKTENEEKRFKLIEKKMESLKDDLDMTFLKRHKNENRNVFQNLFNFLNRYYSCDFNEKLSLIIEIIQLFYVNKMYIKNEFVKRNDYSDDLKKRSLYRILVFYVIMICTIYCNRMNQNYVAVGFHLKKISHLSTSLGDKRSSTIISITILAILLHDEAVTKLSDFFASTEMKVDISHPNAKNNYKIVKNLPLSMRLSKPPIHLDLIIRLCIGDYLSIAMMILTNINRQTPMLKIISCVKKLTNMRVSVQKHRIRLIFLISVVQQLDLYQKMLSPENHYSIQQVLFKATQQLFFSNPKPETWSLYYLCHR
ncbi:hypothetical protein ALC53_11658 [Atta colombica]|uniref:Uncharacterized protein n=1 Tax=Atta colombica TaxID=520822 RepID=A0A195B102_9HYME|nr:hypothetical protein ALC53_11658 [Atta colombica]